MVTLTGLFLFNFIPPPLFSEFPRCCNIVTLVTVPLLAGHLNRTYQPGLIYDTIFFFVDIITFITGLPRTRGWWHPAGPGSRGQGGDTRPRPASAILRPSPGRSPANISRSEACILTMIRGCIDLMRVLWHLVRVVRAEHPGRQAGAASEHRCLLTGFPKCREIDQTKAINCNQRKL